MSVPTRNRFLLLVCFAMAAVPAAFAADPAARTSVRMTYDPLTERTVLFGGATPADAGTQLTYELADTWEWVGDHWVERFPAHNPPGRSANTMVYDTARGRSVIFGGDASTTKTALSYLNDTWAYDGTDWTQLTPAASPTARAWAGAAYDSTRDRIVLFGGYTVNSDAKSFTPVYDTWEYDGTTWKQTSTTGPTAINPILVFDPSRNEMLMMATDTTSAQKVLMYSYDASAAKWNPIVPPTVPDCVDGANMVFQETDKTIILFGGTCTSSSVTGETWQWTGDTWSKMTTVNDPDRLSGQAMTYDSLRQQVMMYGGTLAFSVPRAATLTLKDAAWNELHDPYTPASRSLFTMTSDPDTGTIWMFGGQNQTDVITEFWSYANGKWTPNISLASGPSFCSTPTAAYDTDRKKLVVVCADSSTFEFDPAAQTWGAMSPKTAPNQRRFSSMAYDQTLKKTVLFGGYDDNGVFQNQTWLWNGTDWTQQKNNPPTGRQLAAMWYDPQMKKTLIYGGIGRASSLDRIERYSDMWSFDGNGWTEMKSVTATPGQRYGAQIALDPTTNTLLLFGGMRLDTSGQLSTQVYANDFWKWDGAAQTWTQLQLPSLPTGRENGGLAWDPAAKSMVLFGGYNGLFLSDRWNYDPAHTAWTRYVEPISNPNVPTPPRRRAIGGH